MEELGQVHWGLDLKEFSFWVVDSCENLTILHKNLSPESVRAHTFACSFGELIAALK